MKIKPPLRKCAAHTRAKKIRGCRVVGECCAVAALPSRSLKREKSIAPRRKRRRIVQNRKPHVAAFGKTVGKAAQFFAFFAANMRREICFGIVWARQQGALEPVDGWGVSAKARRRRYQASMNRAAVIKAGHAEKTDRPVACVKRCDKRAPKRVLAAARDQRGAHETLIMRPVADMAHRYPTVAAVARERNNTDQIIAPAPNLREPNVAFSAKMVERSSHEPVFGKSIGF